MMSSSQCIVPNWNLRQQQRQVGEEGEERNRSSHVQSHQNLTHSYVVPMNNKDVMELTWHNGQLALNELESLNPAMGMGDHTLESIVHRATATNFNTTNYHQQPSMPVGNSGTGRRMHADAAVAEQSGKRVRSEAVEESACGSASAAFCRETDTTMMTWNSFESPRSLKCARTGGDDDSLYQDCSENQEGERDTKGGSCRSQSSARRSRAAAIHNLSERRRRDRINEKMKALQKLVPNASKTDKASMLDEVIEYLKQLQAQVHMMSNARNNNNIMPHMVMPNLGMQQQLQMSLLARMGMGMGMSMGMGMTNLPPPFMQPATAPFVSPPPFPMPPMVPPKPTADASAAPNFNDAYSTFLAQSMNMEFLNKMSAIYRQQSSQQPSKKPVSLSLPNDAQGG